MLARIAPALLLFVLSPFVGELMHGDLTVHQLTGFPLLAMLYGGGSIFIRELARRRGRGWPTILLLAAAYGLLEEAFVTQSLFDRHYLGLHLLDYGFLAGPGVSPARLVYLLGLHVVWSIAVPAALTESLFHRRGTAPWLRGFGFTLSAVLFVLASVVGGLGNAYTAHFVASAGQFGVSGAAVVLLVIAAFALTRRYDGGYRATLPPAPPRPVTLAVLAAVAGSLFVLLTYRSAPSALLPTRLAPPAAVTVAAVLVLAALMCVVVGRASRRAGWAGASVFALAAGALAVYCWEGFLTADTLHGATGVRQQVIWLALAVLLMVVTGVRLHRAAPLPARA